ncbi:hypothetical protein FZEAL_2407 [Fusarium zealandicum]|uniref:Uncharacterized protein n=1 Tax=Fusarium zealandicum TaxID=1053134 RepID=A0A8H4UQW2_9HYPO|nr:hypothetical protein FZEAL_2407 [Fusarium zealandicum]
MCGPENTNRPRGGALVALNPPVNTISSTLRGDLAFHTPGSPASANATHARLTPSEECNMKELSDLHIVIHSSGDLSRDASDCGMFRQFAFPSAPSKQQDYFVELPLERPLSLEVGSEGIIGRRVSLYAGQHKIVAEGIVGFNFMSQESTPPSSPSPSL